jgi:hypothetical protein
VSVVCQTLTLSRPERNAVSSLSKKEMPTRTLANFHAYSNEANSPPFIVTALASFIQS